MTAMTFLAMVCILEQYYFLLYAFCDDMVYGNAKRRKRPEPTLMHIFHLRGHSSNTISFTRKACGGTLDCSSNHTIPSNVMASYTISTLGNCRECYHFISFTFSYFNIFNQCRYQNGRINTTANTDANAPFIRSKYLIIELCNLKFCINKKN